MQSLRCLEKFLSEKLHLGHERTVCLVPDKRCPAGGFGRVSAKSTKNIAPMTGRNENECTGVTSAPFEPTKCPWQ